MVGYLFKTTDELIATPRDPLPQYQESEVHFYTALPKCIVFPNRKIMAPFVRVRETT